MKQFFLESGADVVRAIESEIEAMASSDRRLLHQHRRSVAPGGATGSTTIAGSGSGSLAYLSILLGLVEQQLVHPKNLVPVSTSRGRESRHDEDQDEEEGDDDESLLRLKTDDEPHEEHDDEDEPEEEADEHEVDFCLPNPIPFSRIKGLESQFKCLIKGSIDLSVCDVSHEDGRREVVSRVAHVIWSNLSTDHHHHSSHSVEHTSNNNNNNKDSTQSDQESLSSSSAAAAAQHVQFLSSFLTDRRLDSFGVSAAVVAGLQVLFPSSSSSSSSSSCVKTSSSAASAAGNSPSTHHHISHHTHNNPPSTSMFHLTLSEDHSWVSVSDPKTGVKSRLEVTWHAKSDKRLANNNNSSRSGSSSQQQPDNWLYLKGNSVTCHDLPSTAVALICSLNPGIGCNSDSLPLACLQKRLLSFCHSRGLLTRYPMALGSLADLIDLTTSHGGNKSKRRQQMEHKSMSLYIESIASSVSHFRDHHIYPYLYLAGFCFRKRKWAESLFNWKKAAIVLSRFNYNPKEDEEAYRELQEIASDLIPHAISHLMTSSSGLTPENYRDLIEFYDGLCGWEEESKWPVLHIGWSKSLVSCLNKFPPEVRSRVVVRVIDGHHHHGEKDVNERIRDDEDDDEEDNTTGSTSSSSSCLVDRNNEDPDDDDDDDVTAEKKQQKRKRTQQQQQQQPLQSTEMASIVEKCSQDPEFLLTDSINRLADHHDVDDEDNENEEEKQQQQQVVARVSSAKMRELKDLLVKKEKGKLNSSAIQLQITAQSSLFSSSSHLMKRHHNTSSLFASSSSSSGHNTRHHHLFLSSADHHHHRSSPSTTTTTSPHDLLMTDVTSCSSSASTTGNTEDSATRTPSPSSRGRGGRGRGGRGGGRRRRLDSDAATAEHHHQSQQKKVRKKRQKTTHDVTKRRTPSRNSSCSQSESLAVVTAEAGDAVKDNDDIVEEEESQLTT